MFPEFMQDIKNCALGELLIIGGHSLLYKISNLKIHTI